MYEVSYWEQESLLKYDYVIIGSGITGLSLAINLKEKFPGSSVLILERGLLPTGASTRNAGFACTGSLTEILADLENMNEADVLALVNMRKEGLQLLRNRLGDTAIDYKENGSYELIDDRSLHALEQLEHVNKLLKPVFDGNAFSIQNDKIRDFKFNNNRVKALIQNHFEGEIHTGKMMRQLLDTAIKLGVEIKTGCEVESFEEHTQYVRLEIKGLHQQQLSVQANYIAICTNAFTPKLISNLDIQPGRGQVLITYPVQNLPFKGIFHFDEGFYYFREINGRVLFGGGRNEDFAGETTDEPGINQKIQNKLEQYLREMILPGTSFIVAQRWSGIMAFGDKDKMPILRPYGNRVFIGARLGGMGVAIGSLLGQQLCEMMPA
ncbi:FAD-dependent oxidoreductase [Chitinophaga caeni]|uniref:FAD-dependent oxidoreductase n=1 Tax=Chitinophaga caeni TaxID=2029983 RepID=A0A291QUL7_9BACT|nr:FAD-dependent oxidoreductase [Chitinophaga caeni]ATL47650.1 FAD-dependent oxidoreductase [Chitinophaga caeni]